MRFRRLLVVLAAARVVFMPPAAIGQSAVTEPPLAGHPVVPQPSFAPFAARRVQVGDSVRIPLIVNDVPVGAVVDFQLSRQPASARVENGMLLWRPLRSDANASYVVGVRALAAGVELARGSVEISVADAHRAPIIRQPTDRMLPPGDSLMQSIDAYDPDGDVLSVAASNLTDPSLPPRYDRGSSTLLWQAPRSTLNRVYRWRITVDDGDGGTASTELHVAVRAQNVPPVCAAARTYRRDEGDVVDVALEAEDANGDSLAYQPAVALPNGVVQNARYRWTIPYAFVSPTRQDSTFRFEWRATDPSGASTSTNCFALVTVARSIAEEPFRMKQQRHRQLLVDARAQLARYATRETATRDSVSAAASRKRLVKRASLVSALVGGLLQIAKSEDTRRIAAGVSATLTVGFGGWEATIEDGGPLSTRAEAIARDRAGLQRALAKFVRKYDETVSREALLGTSYEADYQELFEMLLATEKGGA